VVPGYLLSRFSGKPLVVDLRDPWTYGSLWQPASPQIASWERALASKVLGHASRVVVTSPLTAKEFTQRFPECPSHKMVTITNGYAATEVASERTGHEGKLLLRYIGMLNERRTPDVLLDALAEVLQNDEIAVDLRFEFIGSMGPHADKLRSPALKGTVTSLGKVSYDRSIGLMRGSDVNVLLQTIAEGQDVIAGKTFEYLAANRPILAAVDASGGDAWLMRETNAGLVVDWQDAPGIAAAIRELWRSWKTGQLQEQFSQKDLSAFSRDALARKLSQVLDEVAAEQR
jgi:glycosyltransferase involved in cell wall biosynthesis